MKVSFPHMANYWIAIKALLESMGIEVVVPPRMSERTRELGCKYSPEFACMPFKMNLGSMIEALEIGADVLIQPGSKGACRYGFYSTVQEMILKDLGYKFEMIGMGSSGFSFINFYCMLKKLNRKITFFQFVYSLKYAWRKIYAIDLIEDRIRRLIPYSKDYTYMKKIHRGFLIKIDNASSFKEIDKVREEFNEKLETIKKPSYMDKVKIGIVGELYVVMDPDTNLNIEDKLSKMEVEIIRSMSLTHLIRKYFNKEKLNYGEIAKPYLEYDVSAHGQMSVAETILFSKKGIDGVIHLKPHGCMPEVVAMSALYKVSKDYKISMLFFSFDEHSSPTGVDTRLEAFIELVKRRKEILKNRLSYNING